MLAISCVAFALRANAAPTVTAGSISVAAGIAATVPLTFTAGTTGVAAIQFTVKLPSGWSLTSAAIGAAGTAASKSVRVNGANGIVIVYGENQTAIGSGVVVNLSIKSPATATGANTITIASPIYSDKSGSAVSGNAVNGTVTITASGGKPAITSATTATDKVGTAFSYQITATSRSEELQRSRSSGGYCAEYDDGRDVGDADHRGRLQRDDQREQFLRHGQRNLDLNDQRRRPAAVGNRVCPSAHVYFGERDDPVVRVFERGQIGRRYHRHAFRHASADIDA